MSKGKLIQMGCTPASYDGLRQLQTDGYDIIAALGKREQLDEIKMYVGDNVEVCDEHMRDVVLTVSKPDLCIVGSGDYESLISCARNGVSSLYIGEPLSGEAIEKLDGLCKKYGCTAALVGTDKDICKNVESTLASSFGCKVMM